MSDIEKYFRIVQEKKLTCIGLDRARGAYEKVSTAISNNIAGSIVECGTYRCGCLAMMAKAASGRRPVWGFDTFAGLPKPTEKDGYKAQGRGGPKDLLAPIEVAWSAFDSLGVSRDNITLVPGLFQDTLASHVEALGQIAVLRLDGDWYDSTMVCLETLYDHVTPGGFIIIDDYGHWEGCRKAVDHFRMSRGITVQLHQTDYTEVWWARQ